MLCPFCERPLQGSPTPHYLKCRRLRAKQQSSAFDDEDELEHECADCGDPITGAHKKYCDECAEERESGRKRVDYVRERRARKRRDMELSKTITQTESANYELVVLVLSLEGQTVVEGFLASRPQPAIRAAKLRGLDMLEERRMGLARSGNLLKDFRAAKVEMRKRGVLFDIFYPHVNNIVEE